MGIIRTSVDAKSTKKTTVFKTVVAKPQKGRRPLGMKKTAEAPNKPHTHGPASEAIPAAIKTIARDTKKAASEALVANIIAGRSTITETGLDSLSTSQKGAIARARGWKGYSGLSSKEMDIFLLHGGKKPAPTVGSTRDMREQVSQAKKDGQVSGPVSSLKVADLKAVYAKVALGEKVTVTKPAPNEGTMDWNKGLLRNTDGKGYTTEATALSKKMFKVSVSALKAGQLKELVKALGM